MFVIMFHAAEVYSFKYLDLDQLYLKTLLIIIIIQNTTLQPELSSLLYRLPYITDIIY